MQKTINQAKLPAKIRRIMDESFIASNFSTIADWNIDRLRRIQELVDEIAEGAEGE